MLGGGYFLGVCALCDLWGSLGWAPLVVLTAALLGPVLLTLLVMSLGGRLLERVGREPERGGGAYFAGAVVLGGLSGAVGGNWIRSGLARLEGGERRGVSVREVLAHPQASSFVFTDARVLTDRQGRARWTTQFYDQHRQRFRDAERFALAAPLVGADWQPGDPIVAWVTDYGLGGERRAQIAWDEARGAGRRLGEREGLSGYRSAAEDAQRRHGLRSAPGAVYLTWESEPAANQWRVVGAALALQAAGLQLYLLAVCGHRFLRRSG